ncbi:chaplin [Streptomyces sp. NPDC013178]|uniref:chaplin n=1 Tax=unclassified Streptomyces TaxID=2593676 RepID=UPI0033C596DD
MRRVTRNGVIAVAAASGAMAVTMPAFADSAVSASAAGPPGMISGNGAQSPVHLPVEVCGNTVNAMGALGPAAGAACGEYGWNPESEVSGGDADASSITGYSPGDITGNLVEAPVDAPVNVAGNSVNIVGIPDPEYDNGYEDMPEEEPPPPAEPRPEPPREDPPAASHPDPDPKPAAPSPQVPAPQAPAPHTRAPQAPVPAPQAHSTLARTGADATVPGLAGSAALILGGAVLYRRFRAVAGR